MSSYGPGDGLATHDAGDVLADMTIEDGAPCRFAHNTVIAAAVELVLGTQKSITEIALDLGFENFGNFSTAFKRHTGMSPKAFRRRNG